MSADPIDDLCARLRANPWRDIFGEAADALQRLRVERDVLRNQLPETMQDCTIVFKECEKGHGRLTARNWIDKGCPHCERDALAAILRELLKHADAHERRLGLPLVGSPNHLHDVPGILDSDNGDRAGKPCEECAAWDAARAARAKWEDNTTAAKSAKEK